VECGSKSKPDNGVFGLGINYPGIITPLLAVLQNYRLWNQRHALPDFPGDTHEIFAYGDPAWSFGARRTGECEWSIQ